MDFRDVTIAQSIDVAQLIVLDVVERGHLSLSTNLYTGNQTA